MDTPTSRTLEGANANLALLGFPAINAYQFGFVNDLEGARFWACLDKAVLSKDRRSAEMQDLARVLSPMSPGAREVIRSLGFDPDDLVELVQISKSEGADFRRALRTVGEGGDNAAAAAEYLSGLMVGAVQRTCSHSGTNAGMSVAVGGGRAPLGASHVVSEGIGSSRSPRAETSSAQRSPPPIATEARPERAPAAVVPPQVAAATAMTGTYGRSVHFYGARSAACVSADVSRRLTPAVKIDFASAVGPQHYDWANKRQIQLTPGEVALLYGVLAGLGDQVSFHHAGRDSKQLVVKQQSGAHYFAFTAGQESFALQLAPQDAFMVLGLLLTQLCAVTPGLPVDAVVSLVKRTCELQQLAEGRRTAGNAKAA